MLLNHFKAMQDFKTLPDGTTVYSAGSTDPHLYGVRQGQVELWFNDTLVEVVEEGGVLGERSFIDKQPHNTTAVTRGEVEIVLIDEARFLTLVQETPMFALQLMRLMVKRSRAMLKVAFGLD